MIAGSFCVGQRLQRRTIPCRVERALGGDRVVLENLSTGQFEEKAIAELVAEWGDGHLVIGDMPMPGDDSARKLAIRGAHLDLFRQSYTQEQQEEARAKLLFVKELENFPRTADVMTPLIHLTWLKHRRELRVAKCGLTAEPHFTTVARWIKWYHSTGCDIRALVSRHHDKGSHASRIDADLERVAQDLIETRYLTQERPSLEMILKELRGMVAQRNTTRLRSEQLRCPSYAYLKRRIQALPPFDVCRARYGQRIADIKFRAAGRGVCAQRPLARAAMDHTRLDVFVVDAQTRLPLGRPWLTMIVDECTRYVLGYYVGFESPSGVSTANALRHAIAFKKTSKDVQSDWDAWGLMETLVVDNGLEFHSDALELGAGRLGITIEFCPRRKPWFKGKIERFFGTLNSGLLQDMKGKTFSNVLLKGDYDPAKHAVLTLATLRRVLEIWIVDVYHQTTHRGLGQCPQQAWKEAAVNVDRRLPARSIDVEAAFSRTEKRKLTHKGIELDTLLYNSEGLRAVREQYGSEIAVEVKVRDDDLSSICVVAPDGRTLLQVPALEQEYTVRLTRWQHNVCKRYKRRVLDDDRREIGLLAARRAIWGLIEKDMLLSSSSGTRVRQQRFLQSDICAEDDSAANDSAANGMSDEPCSRPQMPTSTCEVETATESWPDTAPGDDIPVLPSRKLQEARS